MFLHNSKRYFCVKKNPFSHTVILPKTKLPLRLEGQKLLDRDTKIHNICGFDQLYKWQKSNLNDPEFVLHDGPPYANGAPHMGHAINKILKDTILRYKILEGQKVDYRPGWDCHGLPIELKAINDKKSNNDDLEIRNKASFFADQTINKQMEVFKSWGILGDWENYYQTKSVNYVENQIKIFLKLYENGYIYRAVKPIYWSPSSRTALAEAELEYNENHKSPSAYVRINIKNIPEVPSLLDGKKIYAVIWTTTPWTLPSNQAICYNNTLSYCIVKKPDINDNDLYIIATDLYHQFCKEVNCEYQLLGVHSGELLKEATYFHPVYKENICKFLHSNHAISTKGTGLVHTAPAHGHDDFLVGIRNKLNIVDLVSDEGRYRNEAGELFSDKFVLTEGNATVLEYLGDDLLKCGEYTHSYPYDWRTKKPVIIKASKQWFIDTEKIKEKAVVILSEVDFKPAEKSEIYKKNFINQIEKRPYWCISRQRKWGVPIPVFYNNETEETLINNESIEHICTKLNEFGTDFWWKLPLNELLPENCRNIEESYVKSNDILDIWFDSGISWSFALKPPQIADLYLEGYDQFNGWFQSSLITSVALRKRSPYKSIFVHGFAVDKNGQKMSKSLGNVINPTDIIKGTKKFKSFGIDTLRWWVNCHGSHTNSASVSENIMEHSKDEVQKIRSVLRFCIGALNDYTYCEEDFANIRFNDQYILHLLYENYQKVKTELDSYNFYRINAILTPILTNQISAQYFTSIKDRLYCEAAKSATRNSAQFTLLQIYHTISLMVGGILPHLVEECYSYLPQNMEDTFFTSRKKLQPSEKWQNFAVEKAMEVLMEIRKEINRFCETGASIKSDVKVGLSSENYTILQPFIQQYPGFMQDLEDILQVSSVELNLNAPEEVALNVEIVKSAKFSCPRCRLIQSEVEDGLCGRCMKVVEEMKNSSSVAEADAVQV